MWVEPNGVEKAVKVMPLQIFLRMFEPLIREARHTIAVKFFYFTITGYLEE